MICKDCPDKKCETTGKPCKKVEVYLRSQGIKGREWIRPKISSDKRKKGESEFREIPISSLNKKFKRDNGFHEYLYDDELLD